MDNNVRYICKSEDVFCLKEKYSDIVIYGTGKAAGIFYEKFRDFLKVFNTVSFCQSTVFKGEKYFSADVHNYRYLSGLCPESCAVIVCTYEKIQEEIIEQIRTCYSGQVYCLKNGFIDGLSHILNVKERISEGSLPITYAEIPNMGDQLNTFIIKRMYGINSYNELIRYSYLTGVGSILEGLFADKKQNDETEYPLYIWGSGFNRHTDISEKYPVRDDIRFCCLRGYKSKEKLENYYGCSLDCAVGDPGLLALYMQDKNVTKHFSIGIIPHWRENELELVNDLYGNYKNAVLINLRSSVESVLTQIAECEVILTSSLHGAIVADSLGVPNKLVKISDFPTTDGFKYEDYYSVFDTSVDRVDLRYNDPPTIEQITDEYSINYEIVKQIAEQIRDCFPVKNMSDLKWS